LGLDFISFSCYNSIVMGKVLSILSAVMCLCMGCRTQEGAVAPILPPPVLAEAILQGKEVQINHLPHPLNVKGTLPFAVWVDGERVPLNTIELQAIGQTLNIDFNPPPDTPEIHNGAGWVYPFRLVKDDSD
jgi:hypothetical protein